MSKPIIYFENLSFYSLLSVLLKTRFAKILLTAPAASIYYIESTLFIEKWVLSFLRKCNINIEKLDFKMMDVVDDAGELVRIRIPRENLFDIQKKILSSRFNGLIDETWQQDRLMNYLAKGVTDGEIMDDQSASRVLFIVLVIYWHMEQNKYDKSQFVIDDRPWFNIYAEFAGKHSIELFSLKKVSMFPSKRHIHKFIRFHPKLYALIKNIKYRRLFDCKAVAVPAKHRLYVEGRGDINLENNGDHSDFFWYLNSDFPPDNILYKHLSDSEESYLKEQGITSVGEGVISNGTHKRNYTKPEIKHEYRNTKEYDVIKNLISSYDLDRYFWSSFFKAYGVKVYFTWYKYSKDHIAVADAISDNNGISVLWQMGFEGYEEISSYVNFDISFCFSKFSHEIKQRLNSSINYSIITGYTKDYVPPLLKARAMDLRKKMQANGAKKIVFVIDENSINDARWHTGHALQQENYSHILEKVLEVPWLGVIFKPKVAKTLRKRLGPVEKLLSKAEETGRCYVYESTGRHTTSAPPILAGLSADICVHGHLSAGTAALECALEGLPTLLIDREGIPTSKLQELPEGNVVFKDWPSTIDAIMEHFKTPEGLPGFGDWSSIIDELDPFRDGLAAKRIGDYLHWLLQGYEQGLDKNSIMEIAAEKYRKQWGDDKVITE